MVGTGGLTVRSKNTEPVLESILVIDRYGIPGPNVAKCTVRYDFF